MRDTPIPLLCNLPPGVVVTRCGRCRELVLLDEECRNAAEALRCLPRQLLELPPPLGFGRPTARTDVDWMLP